MDGLWRAMQEEVRDEVRAADRSGIMQDFIRQGRVRICSQKATGKFGAEELHDLICVLKRSHGYLVENALWGQE